MRSSTGSPLSMTPEDWLKTRPIQTVVGKAVGGVVNVVGANGDVLDAFALVVNGALLPHEWIQCVETAIVLKTPKETGALPIQA